MMTLFRPYFVNCDTLFRPFICQFSTLLRRTFWRSKYNSCTTFKKLEVRYKNYFKIIFRLLRDVYLDFCGNTRTQEIISKLFDLFMADHFFISRFI